MNDSTFQTQHPDGLTVHLDSDCLLAIERALGTLEDFFDTTFKFFAEDAVRSILLSINAAAAFDYYDRARTQHIATAISTKSSAASIIPNDHDRICHCNTCGVDR